MSTKFFTNADQNTLFNKFEGIFKYTNVYYLDILVGYFYSSGYFKIRKFLNDVSEIRILVGIDLDNRAGEFADIDHLIPAETDHQFRGKLTT